MTARWVNDGDYIGVFVTKTRLNEGLLTDYLDCVVGLTERWSFERDALTAWNEDGELLYSEFSGSEKISTQDLAARVRDDKDGLLSILVGEFIRLASDDSSALKKIGPETMAALKEMAR